MLDFWWCWFNCVLIVRTYLFKPFRRLTVSERLQPTINVAKTEKAKFEKKARMTGYTLNAAIGLQVLLGSLTTGLSAVAASSGKQASSVQSMLISSALSWLLFQTAVSTTILGTLNLLRFCHWLLIEDVSIFQRRTGDFGSFLPRKSPWFERTRTIDSSNQRFGAVHTSV